MASLQELLNAQSAVADRNRAKDWSARNRAAFGGLLGINEFLPVTGDIQSGILAAQDLNEGAYGSAALNALGLLPFVPAMGGVVKKAGKTAKTQYEIAQDVAQRNAALPISEGGLGLPKNNTAMDRAKAMGFTVGGYHGTGKVYDAMEANRRGVNFTTPDPDFANKYAGAEYSIEVGDQPNIIPTLAKSNKIFDYENKADVEKLAQHASLGKLAIDQIKKGDWQRLEDRTILETLKKLGYDGLYVKEEGIKNFAAFNPSQIRSRFAAFDPARINDPNLLAGIGGASLAGLLGLSLLDQQQYD